MNAPWVEQQWVEHLGWTLIHFLWQGTLIAAAYGAVRRSRTPQLRYLLACVALAAIVAAPVVTYIVTTPAAAPANSRNPSRTMPGPGILLAACLLAITAHGLFAQPPAPLSFEAATIKINNGENRRFSFAASPGRLHVVGNPTSNLIGNAYGIHNDIEGGPEWINSDLYDLEAKAEGNPTEKQMMQMLQMLLEDRFKLKVHVEQREEPVFELLPVKSGIKIQRETEQDCVRRDSARQPKTEPDLNPSAFCGNNTVLPKGTNMQWTLTDSDMTNLAETLSGMVGRKVIDKTGFHGTFSFQAEFMRDQSATSVPDLTGTSILNVLQGQLGLRLESVKGPVDVLVIDRIERPSEN
jgi:uncharacterized protein (TIGR03435 family)